MHWIEYFMMFSFCWAICRVTIWMMSFVYSILLGYVVPNNISQITGPRHLLLKLTMTCHKFHDFVVGICWFNVSPINNLYSRKLYPRVSISDSQNQSWYPSQRILIFNRCDHTPRLSTLGHAPARTESSRLWRAWPGRAKSEVAWFKHSLCYLASFLIA